MIDQVDEVQQFTGKPLVVENITEVIKIPSPMEANEFLHKLVSATGCGLLLDVANLYANSVNHAFDAFEHLDRMPLERVVQVHIAGGVVEDGVVLDSHSHPVHEQTWKLLSHALPRMPVQAIILEQDKIFPPDLRGLLSQVRRARDMTLSVSRG